MADGQRHYEIPSGAFGGRWLRHEVEEDEHESEQIANDDSCDFHTIFPSFGLFEIRQYPFGLHSRGGGRPFHASEADCLRERLHRAPPAFSKHLSVASHFEAGKTSKAPFKSSRRMPRQCQRKFLS
jgi:hypothetical protein